MWDIRLHMRIPQFDIIIIFRALASASQVSVVWLDALRRI